MTDADLTSWRLCQIYPLDWRLGGSQSRFRFVDKGGK